MAQFELQYGLKRGGGNISFLFGAFNDNDRLSSRSGLHGGTMLEFRLYDRHAIHVEALYAEMGQQGCDGNFHLDYLAIPIHFSYHLFNSGLN